jgi:hypothetical protein
MCVHTFIRASRQIVGTGERGAHALITGVIVEYGPFNSTHMAVFQRADMCRKWYNARSNDDKLISTVHRTQYVPFARMSGTPALFASSSRKHLHSVSCELVALVITCAYQLRPLAKGDTHCATCCEANAVQICQHV